MRKRVVNRKTGETDIKLSINLDDSNTEKNKINTGCGFLDHMLIGSMLIVRAIPTWTTTTLLKI